MPRGLKNWTFRDVTRFLKDNDFRHNHVRGSHYYYIKRTGKTAYQVSVPFHGKDTIKPRTMKGIIAQSGIPQEAWTGRKKRN